MDKAGVNITKSMCSKCVKQISFTFLENQLSLLHYTVITMRNRTYNTCDIVLRTLVDASSEVTTRQKGMQMITNVTTAFMFWLYWKTLGDFFSVPTLGLAILIYSSRNCSSLFSTDPRNTRSWYFCTISGMYRCHGNFIIATLQVLFPL